MTAVPTSSIVPALELRGVAVHSTRETGALALEDVQWSVAEGDFWVVGGWYGSGKSGLLTLMGGMSAAAAGECCFYGEPLPILEGEKLAERLRLGYVFDGGQLLHHLTVAENLTLPLRYHKNPTEAETDEILRRWLDRFELTAWADTTPGAVSRSRRKRAGLARALILEPDVLLLDNPLSGLDARQVGWWLNFLTHWWQGKPPGDGRPRTLVATTDDFRPWIKVARQFALLKDGRFGVLSGPDELAAASAELVRELGVGEQND